MPIFPKPPLGSVIDWGHPLSNGLQGCWILNEGSGKIINNLVPGKVFSDNLLSNNASFMGGGVYLDGTDDCVYLGYWPNFIEFSLVVGINFDSAANYYSFAGADDNSANRTFQWRITSTGLMQFLPFYQAGGNGSFNGPTLPSNTIGIAVVTMAKNGQVWQYLNGGQATPGAGTGPIITTENALFGFGERPTSTTTGLYDTPGFIYFGYVYNRAITAREVYLIYNSPYSFIKKQSIVCLPSDSGPADPFAAASNPIPSDTLTDVDINQDLSWTGHGQPDSYDLYLDTVDGSTLEAEDLTEAVYDPGELDAGETYYWKVVSKKSGESDATSDVWSFTTAAATTRKARTVIIIT